MSKVVIETGLERRIHKRFEWRVRNFSALLELPDLLASQKFEFLTDHNNIAGAGKYIPQLVWKLFLTPKDEGIAMWYSPRVDLINKRSLPFTIIYECQAGVEMKSGSKAAFKKTSKMSFTEENYTSLPKTCLFTLKKEMIPNLATSGIDQAITIHFMLSIYSEINTPAKISAPVSGGDKLKAQNLKLLKSGDYADVKIISKEGKEFPAHKLILRDHIRGFADMFRNETEEIKNGIVRLNDMSSASVEFLLHYTYTFEIPPFSADSIETLLAEGRSDDDFVSVHDVLHMARKFGITDVRNHLDNCLDKMLTFENARELFQLARKYSLSNAMEKIALYMKTHAGKIRAEPGHARYF